MKLSLYIKRLQELFEEVGDTENLYQSIDDEGNGYNKVHYSPAIYYVSKSEDENRPEGLVPERGDEDVEEFANCYGFEIGEDGEIDYSDYKKVILL